MSVILTKHLHIETEARFEQDWSRQRRTAADILSRLEHQEGVILADQVGMGKTYVALAVAVSQILSTPELGQVVIFVPPAVADKWVREWKKFSESLLRPGTGIRCVDKPVRSGEEFLKKLGDSLQDRAHIVVMTHNALTATLKDSFIQLALLHYATRNIHGGGELRERIAKWSTGLTGLIANPKFDSDRVRKLLKTPPSRWRDEWARLTGEALPDDPVPEALDHVASSVDLRKLRDVIDALPIRSSSDIERRLRDARKELSRVTQDTWKRMLSSTKLDLPLLIVDEAHRLKNPATLASKLFSQRADGIDAGAFRDIFRRMLFLTATPFELRHSELIEVLTRMEAVKPSGAFPDCSLKERLEKLSKVLTDAQACAQTLDDAWGRLDQEDISAFEAWGTEVAPPANLSVAAREAWEHARLAVSARHELHRELQPWVIRHERVRRRAYHPGALIASKGDGPTGGLPIPDSAALPFLLAARAQSLAVDEKNARPLFAYGIASSYEAFRRLGAAPAEASRDSDEPDDDNAAGGTAKNASTNKQGSKVAAIGWYRREIERSLDQEDVCDAHPKVRATVGKAAQLWLEGEKCLIFCWFIRTGEAVEHALAKHIDRLIAERARALLSTSTIDETRAELDRISDRLFRRDGSSYARIRQRLRQSLKDFAIGHEDVLDLVVDSAIRHLRTPGYLVRYTRLNRDINDEDVWAGIKDGRSGGMALLDRWRLFAERLARTRNQIEANAIDERDSEFARIRNALLGTHTEDDQSTGRGASLHPVRRAHGGTERDVRERLIASFNTPLSPELLVASSVMGEGIDLHQECRFVIHHDLDWNPSVLEQRTGRLDRIGALAERVKGNIEVFEPYLAGTHDEKMFRVVKDRAQWFDIVMGRASGSDDRKTDAEERRLPLHDRIREALTMDLRSPERDAQGTETPICEQAMEEVAVLLAPGSTLQQ